MPRIRELAPIIKEIQKGGVYRCQLQDHKAHTIDAYICGKMRIKRITLEPGDEVSVELSPYDLKKGRIVYRF